jgi:uncharacterized LabA/DUF88 family protein
MTLIKDIIRGKTLLKKQDKRAFVCVDYGNWDPFLRKKKLEIDWAEFRSLMGSIFNFVEINFYDGVITEPFYRHNFPNASDEEVKRAKRDKIEKHRAIRQLGYKVVSKDISAVYRGFYKDHAAQRSLAQRVNFKCNFDVEITVDAMDYLAEYDVFVLCSGDRDFVELVKRLKSKLKETMAISIENRFSEQLKSAVNRFEYLNNLIHYVPALTKPKK